MAQYKYRQLHDKEWLIDHYWNKHLSTADIAGIIGCSAGNVVYTAMRKLNIKTRTISEANVNRIPISKEELFDLYWNQDLTQVEISKIYDCDPTTIHNTLVRYGIKIKTHYESRKNSDWSVNIPKDELKKLYLTEKKSMLDIAELYHCSTGTVFRNIKNYEISSRPFKTPAKHAICPLSKELLEKLYWKEGLTTTQIAKKLGYHFVTIHEHMVEYGINYRTKSERYQGKRNPMFGRRGEKAPGWKGGTSFEPYCPKFNDAFKESVREKFDRICFLCPTTEEENGQKLSVHHVNYNKNCLCEDSDCEFVPLCIKCHGKTGHNREYWDNLITEKLQLT